MARRNKGTTPLVIPKPADAPPVEAVKRQRWAWLVSLLIHSPYIAALIILQFTLLRPLTDSPPDELAIAVKAEDTPKHNFDNEDVGLDPSKKLNYKVDRIEDVSVPGPMRPAEPIGIDAAPAGGVQNVAPPPGLGGGAGGGLDQGPAIGNPFGDPGGYVGGRFIPGQMFGGRSGATREKMVAEGGGNAASEAAVAKGLKWLQKQQKADGHWTMVEGTVQDDLGATGLALLPFLAAGITHKVNSAHPDHAEYVKTVDRGIRWLVSKQPANGLLGNRSKHYSHAICTIVLCEAYGMTADPMLKKPAQRALDYLIKAQHSAGGFRYEVAEPGDTSVTGWCLQALQSGRLAGLNVPSETLTKVGKFLDSVQTQEGAAYGYLGPGNRPTMTAVGLLCRAYLGWGPKNPKMIAGVENIKSSMPRKSLKDIYYYYYATQVMHFCATADDWKRSWNPNMRDLLIDTQDNSTGPNRGSWEPDELLTGNGGGRMVATSLSLLTLEVYYRHLPLYRLEKPRTEPLD
ncbi:MAG: prenyltransferase/squalene oxidase repeat-containing protein [Gemmataceae bacterium]